MAFTSALMIMSSCCKASVGLVVFLLVVNRISADPESLQDFCVAYTTSSIYKNRVPCQNPDEAYSEPLQEFCAAEAPSSFMFMNGLPCLNPKEASPEHFMTSALGKAGNVSANPFGFSAVLATTENMPGINTLGLAMARADIGVGGLIPLHTHPRASEIIFLVEGDLNVGFVDTSNRLFSKKLKAGDVFILDCISSDCIQQSKSGFFNRPALYFRFESGHSPRSSGQGFHHHFEERGANQKELRRNLKQDFRTIRYLSVRGIRRCLAIDLELS